MNNIFKTEIIKLKKNKMAFIGCITTILIPILLILKSVIIDKNKINYQEWIQTVSMLVNIVLPIMSGFFITQSIQKEYGEKTIINIITAPVNRTNFVLGKILVWLCWYLVVMIITLCITILGSLLLFHSQVTNDTINLKIKLFTQTSILSFIAFLPIIWVAIKQRTLFYPTMLFTLFFVFLQTVGSQISEQLIKVASFVPWLAIQITTMLTADNQCFYVSIASILCSGIIGIILAINGFKNKIYKFT